MVGLELDSSESNNFKTNAISVFDLSHNGAELHENIRSKNLGNKSNSIILSLSNQPVVSLVVASFLLTHLFIESHRY